MKAIAEEHHARWYFLLAGLVLLVWFGIGVIRALNVAHSVAWSLRPEKLRRPLFAGLAFSGIVIDADRRVRLDPVPARGVRRHRALG